MYFEIGLPAVFSEKGSVSAFERQKKVPALNGGVKEGAYSDSDSYASNANKPQGYIAKATTRQVITLNDTNGCSTEL